MDKTNKINESDSYHDRNLSNNDDDESSINSDDDLTEIKYEWMNNPFSIIDDNANLDDVLNAKTIGEAMQILCPNIPGK